MLIFFVVVLQTKKFLIYVFVFTCLLDILKKLLESAL